MPATRSYLRMTSILNATKSIASRTAWDSVAAPRIRCARASAAGSRKTFFLTNRGMTPSVVVMYIALQYTYPPAAASKAALVASSDGINHQPLVVTVVVGNGVALEDYPDEARGPSCLITWRRTGVRSTFPSTPSRTQAGLAAAEDGDPSAAVAVRRGDA